MDGEDKNLMRSLTLPLCPFYFIRHGETDWNRRNIIMGSRDIPLNEVELKQAHQATHNLLAYAFAPMAERLRRRQSKEISRASATCKLRLPGRRV